MNSKQKKQELIIEKAREILLEKGLMNTVMDDIAIHAGLTRRTLYRYFATKEDLVYEIAIRLLTEWNAFHIEAYESLSGNGIERLETFLNALIDYMVERAGVMKYLSEFDLYFDDSKSEKPNTDSMLRFNEIILESDALLEELVQYGIDDNTIKENTDIKLMVVTMSNVIWSFAQRIAIRGQKIKLESGISGEEIIRNQANIYMIALRKDK